MDYFNTTLEEKLERYNGQVVNGDSLVNASQTENLVYKSVLPDMPSPKILDLSQILKKTSLPETDEAIPSPPPVSGTATTETEVGGKVEDNSLDSYFSRVNENYQNILKKIQSTVINYDPSTDTPQSTVVVPSQSNDTGPLLERVRRQISASESSHNYGVVNPGADSGAWGRYQFIWGLKPGKGQRDLIKKVTGHTTPEAFLKDPAAQDKYFDYYFQNTLTPELAKFRKELPNIKWSDSQVMEMLHFRGYDGLTGMIRRGELNVRSKHNPSVMDRLNKQHNAAFLNKKPSFKLFSKELAEMNKRLGYS